MFVKTVASFLRGYQIGTDQTATWADSASAGTEKTVTFTRPETPVQVHQVIIHNPSTETALTVKVYDVEADLGGADRNALLTTLSVPKNTTTKHNVEGLFNAGSAKIVLSNDSALGASGGFTATVRIRELV